MQRGFANAYKIALLIGITMASSWLFFTAKKGSCPLDNIASHPVMAILPTNELRIRRAPDRLYTLDILDLHGCALQRTIVKYRSSLGRGASDSQLLMLDLEYLSLVTECILYLSRNNASALANYLEQVARVKREQLPSSIYNATLANREFRKFWTSQAPAVPSCNSTQCQVTFNALIAINDSTRRWLSGEFHADNIEFEIQLSAIAVGIVHCEAAPRHKLLNAARAFEQTLNEVLPPPYRKWQQHRDHPRSLVVQIPNTHVE